MRLVQYLTEKWISAYKVGPDIKDIFVNPSKKELQELHKNSYNSLRFIADSDNKKIYVFDGESLHHERWTQLRKELGDHRKDVHREKSLFAGTVENNKVSNSAFDGGYYGYDVLSDWNENFEKFKFVEKYFAMMDWYKKNSNQIYRQMQTAASAGR